MLGTMVSLGTALAVTVIMPQSAGLAGLALTAALNLTGILNWSVRQSTDLEIQMNRCSSRPCAIHGDFPKDRFKVCEGSKCVRKSYVAAGAEFARSPWAHTCSALVRMTAPSSMHSCNHCICLRHYRQFKAWGLSKVQSGYTPGQVKSILIKIEMGAPSRSAAFIYLTAVFPLQRGHLPSSMAGWEECSAFQDHQC